MKKSFVVAASVFAAGTLVAGSVYAQATHNCAGVNACKGQSACKTADNGCKGQNACKGHGWLPTASAKECTDAGGTVAK